MARPKSNNVDYFPCYCKDGKTLYILESRWGNNGYAFFYKLWKRLGDADFHFIDLRPLDNWEYFRAKMGVSDTETTDILNKLAEMGVIDQELWAQKIVWSDSFVDSVKDAWLKRKQNIPQKPLFLSQKPQLPEQNETETQVSDNQNPQIKINKNKLNKNNISPDGESFSLEFERFYTAYPKHTYKKTAYAEWRKNKNRPDIEIIMSALEKQKRAKEHQRQTGQFVSEWPDPQRWIKNERWNDEVTDNPVNQSTPQSSPYMECPRCHAEVLKDQFIEIDGNKFCEKCPEAREQAVAAYRRLTGIAGQIVKGMPGARP